LVVKVIVRAVLVAPKICGAATKEIRVLSMLFSVKITGSEPEVYERKVVVSRMRMVMLPFSTRNCSQEAKYVVDGVDEDDGDALARVGGEGLGEGHHELGRGGRNLDGRRVDDGG
jgi:hypothetical protein